MRQGDIVWGKMGRYRWWPAVVVAHDSCKSLVDKETAFCLYWYGHGTVSVVKPSLRTIDFKKNFPKLSKPKGCKKFEAGIILALRDAKTQCSNGSSCSDTTHDLKAWANNGFPASRPTESEGVQTSISEHVMNQLKCLSARKEGSLPCKKDKVSCERLSWVAQQSDRFVCLVCEAKGTSDTHHPHPLFQVMLCESCLAKFKDTYFNVDKQYKSVHCLVCLQTPTDKLNHCSADNCVKMICSQCLQEMASAAQVQIKISPVRFTCPFCSHNEYSSLIKSSWSENVFNLFHSASHSFQEKLQQENLNVFCCNQAVDTSIRLLQSLFSDSIVTLFTCDVSVGLVQNRLSQSWNMKVLQSMYSLKHSDLTFVIDIIAGSYAGNESDCDLGKYFFTFFALLGLFRAKKKEDDVLWLFEYPTTFSSNFFCIVNRFLECESGMCKRRGKRIWTNIPALRNLLYYTTNESAVRLN